jgi:single-strand DNA-binding protein
MADNMVTLVGSLGNEPELRTLPQGTEVVNFRLAVNERRRNADGTWGDGPTSWFRVAVWGVLGRNAHASLHKGERVVVQGTLRITEFSTESGSTTRNAEVRALAIGHDLAFGTTAFTRAGQSQAGQAQAGQTQAGQTPAGQTRTAPMQTGGVTPAQSPAPALESSRSEARTLEPAGGGWGAPLTDEDSTPF